MRVMLDPGHGGNDPGTCDDKFVEASYVYRFARYLCTHLAHTAAPVNVGLIRVEDETVSLDERGERAANFGADLVLSLHVNASETTTASGGLTFCWPGDALGLNVGTAIARAFPVPLYRLRAVPIEAVDSPTTTADDWLRRPRAVMWPHQRRGRTDVLVELGYRTNLADRVALDHPAVQWALVLACEAGIAAAYRVHSARNV